MNPGPADKGTGEKPDFMMMRLIVEQYSAEPITSMTWVRFQATLRAAAKLRQLQRPGAESHAERIARQRDREDGEDW